jgi:hypothetical protein
LIERAHLEAEKLGLAVWNEDEAGPYQTVPCPGSSWQPEGEPAKEPHEYLRNGTAKLLTLFHPATGKVHIKGVTSCPNVVLHGWMKEELSTIVATLPEPLIQLSPEENRAVWESWQEGLTVRVTLPAQLPPLRMLLIWDNLAGHKTPELLLWLFSQGILPLLLRSLTGFKASLPIGMTTRHLSSGVANVPFGASALTTGVMPWVVAVPLLASRFTFARPSLINGNEQNK